MLKEDKQRLEEEAKKVRGFPEEAEDIARRFGLDPHDINYWIVDYDTMNELAAYQGFPRRYHHWRWGKEYDKQQKKSQHLGHRIFELVVNNDPDQAYLQESNSISDQKLVVSHVKGHSDFFKNNQWYDLFGDEIEPAAMLGRHAERVDEYIRDVDILREDIEKFIDAVLTVEDLINQHKPPRSALDREKDESDSETENIREVIEESDLDESVKDSVFNEEFYEKLKDETEENNSEEPWEDVLAFIQEYGKTYNEEDGRAEEMKEWQKDILDMLRKEAYYFAPQRMTKIMNEGWATYWHSKLMASAGMADIEEIIDYSRTMANVIDDKGQEFNPYTLGLQLWRYIENKQNRREVIEKLLQVKDPDTGLDVNSDNFYDIVDFKEVERYLQPNEKLLKAGFNNLEDLEELPESHVDRNNLEKAKYLREILNDREIISDAAERTLEALEDLEEASIQENVYDKLGDLFDEEILDSIAENLVKVYLESEEEFETEHPFEKYKENDIFGELMYGQAPTGMSEVIDSYTDSEEYSLKRLIEKSVEEVLDVDRYPWKLLTFEGLAEKHYSLTQPENSGFIESITRKELEEIERWNVENQSKYSSIEEALDDVDKTKGWKKMREEMKNKNDVRFVDEYVTQEFVEENNYYTTEHIPTEEGYMPLVTSVDAEEVKKKLIFQLTNFGKPTIKAHDYNYNNQGGLLLAYHYNGVELDEGQAMKVMERVHDQLWGRDVYLKTIRKKWDKEETSELFAEKNLQDHLDEEMDWEGRIPKPEEEGVLLKYDGENFYQEKLSDEEVEELKADMTDYNTIPQEWWASE
ncbi:MAG: SpoVR family protein [Candidatus Nanohaloarchaea archaeon]|nr:SpoVR family protein [Candidatus Nanohaloarchaea archaeon]